jgi:methyl-accepting chemotaxis protein
MPSALPGMMIRTRILLGFGSVIAVVTCFSLLILFEVVRFSEEKAELDQVDQQISIFKDVQLSTAGVWQFYTDASLTRDREVIEKEALPAYRKAIASLEAVSGMLSETADRGRVADIRREIEALKDTGQRMFDAYLVDWDKGNVVMDDYDRASEAAITSVAGEVARLSAKQHDLIEQMNQLSSRTVWLLLVNLFVSIGGGFAVGSFIARRISRPIKRLMVVADLVARGDVDGAARALAETASV